MIEMNLSDDILKQMGVLTNGSNHKSNFDDEGTLHIVYESHDESTIDVPLSKDDGTLKTIDATKEEDSLKEDIVSTSKKRKSLTGIFVAVIILITLTVALCIAAMLVMR